MLEESSLRPADADPASIHVRHHERNPGVAFDLGWVESAHVQCDRSPGRSLNMPRSGLDAVGSFQPGDRLKHRFEIGVVRDEHRCVTGVKEQTLDDSESNLDVDPFSALSLGASQPCSGAVEVVESGSQGFPSSTPGLAEGKQRSRGVLGVAWKTSIDLHPTELAAVSAARCRTPEPGQGCTAKSCRARSACSQSCPPTVGSLERGDHLLRPGRHRIGSAERPAWRIAP